MNPLLESIYESKKVHNAQGETRDAFPSSVFYEDGMAMYKITKSFEKADTLEIGVAYGASTLFICQAHQENGGGHHIAIDPYQTCEYEGIGTLNAGRAGYADFLEFYEERSFAVLPRLFAEGRSFDFTLIDGNHRFEHAFVDFFYCDRMLKEGGYLMLHDPWMPATRKLLTFILRTRNESFELAPEFMFPPASLLGGCWKGLKSLIDQPVDIAVAKMFARKQFKNFCVVRKKKHLSDDEYDMGWAYYRSF